jgi:hypothetical protein
MALFLLSHMANCQGRLRLSAEHGQLPGIDALCAILAGVIDPDHPFNQLCRLDITGQQGGSGSTSCHAAFLQSLRAALAVTTARISEATALNPAIEMP